MAKYLKWSNNEKDEQAKNWIIEIQKSLGAYPDGMLGKQSLLELYKEFVEVDYPLSTQLFDVDVIFQEPYKIQVKTIKNAHGLEMNQLSGSFQYNNNYNCIAMSDRVILGKNSAHYWLDKPDTCLYYDELTGKVGARRIKNVNELPSHANWAISGVGLHNYNPKAEGYYKNILNGKEYDYSDVLRSTYHTAIGVTQDNLVVGAYIKGNGSKVKDIMINKLKCKYAIMLDGGHIAAINSDYAKHNVNRKQHNIIQF